MSVSEQIIVPRGGEEAGKLILQRTRLPVAHAFALSQFRKNHRVMETDLPDFGQNFLDARQSAIRGNRPRSSMPVMMEDDLAQVHRLLIRMGESATSLCETCVAMATDLVPQQSVIYLDKSVPAMARAGVPATVSWLRSRHLFVANDFQILDGHHGWLSAMLIHPMMRLRLYRFRMPLDRILPALVNLSDSLGRVRNA
jgi:hypothetical protein